MTKTISTHTQRNLLVGALIGLVSGGFTLAVADLVAGVIDQQSTPIIAVGRAFIDLTPGWLKDFAVSRFGTNDKLVLLSGMAATIAVLAIVAGIVSLRRPRVGAALVGLLGAVAVVSAVTRPDAGRLAALPSVIGVLAGAGALLWLSGLVRSRAAKLKDQPDVATSRRQVLTGLAVVAGSALVTGTGGRLLAARTGDGLGPAQVTLPKPLEPLAATPSGSSFEVAGLTPFVTPTRDFYRIDTALIVPRIDARTWKLRLHGMVEREVTLSYAELLALPLIERRVTLTCVSNEVGGTLAGNATWLGYPLAALLKRAGVSTQADMLLSTSADGFTVSTPLSTLLDGRDALIAVGMNGGALPSEHGFPARLVVPGLYGFVSATKWVVDLEVTRFDQAQAYWTRRGWATRAPIHTASRVDVPKPFARVAAGPTAVAGVAWAQHRGIDKVEVQVDDGPWNQARLATETSSDTWRQWLWTWDAPAGMHTLRVRATDRTGAVQVADRRPPKPDGSTGWHSVAVTVT